jgi:hypothetical protein
MSRDPSPEREIFNLEDDYISEDELDINLDDFEPEKKPTKMQKLCKKISSIFKSRQYARYHDDL